MLKNIEWGINKLKSVNFKLEDLKTCGFKICSRCGSTTKAYRHKKKNIVVKSSKRLSHMHPMSEDKPPMVEVYNGFDRSFYQVQAHCKREKSSRAANILKKKYPFFTDIRAANVGWYRNRAVLIDW